jgi:addiction module HigA family antidote
MKTITKTKAKMHNPPHPGDVLKELCLEPLGLTVSEAAKALDVSRKTLSAILNRRAGITPEMALRLSIAFNTTAESWLMQQIQYDLWRAEQRKKKLRVERLAA